MYQTDTNAAGETLAIAPGAGGKAEGKHEAVVKIRTSPNGVAAVIEGYLMTSPLRL